MAFIHQQAGWPIFRWDAVSLSPLLADVRHSQGRLLGRMEGLGLAVRAQATLTTLTADVIQSSAHFWFVTPHPFEDGNGP